MNHDTQQSLFYIVFFGLVILAIASVGFAIGRLTHEQQVVIVRVCEKNE